MSESRFWAVVPAAGVGRRMASDVPKQYLDIGGRMVIEHVVARLLQHPRLDGVYVVLSADDGYWQETQFARHPEVVRVVGGEERFHSVLNALDTLARIAAADDWVLVHDAARPCVRTADISKLIDSVVDHPVGGLLAMPVRDTMKRADANCRVAETLDRRDMWHAFTPQMFRLEALRQALSSANDAGVAVTDESSAMELAGYAPLLVEGHPDNIKITRPQDLDLAAYYLAAQAED